MPLLVLFVIPGVNVIAPLLWLVFGAWMLALQYADYPMGNHGLRFRSNVVYWAKSECWRWVSGRPY
ncbi:MAG: hypothetical protein R3F37_05475 [Candidatus Competibacteraceae bacterium]